MNLRRSSSDLYKYESVRGRGRSRRDSSLPNPHSSKSPRSKSNEDHKTRREHKGEEEFKWYKSQHGKKRRYLKRFVRRHILRKQSKRLSKKLEESRFGRPKSLRQDHLASSSSDSEPCSDSADEIKPSLWMPLQDPQTGPTEVNSWSPIPGSAFNCRIGPNYAKQGRKAPSGPCLYDSLHVAIWESSRKQSHVAQHLKLPSTTNDKKLPEFLVVNVMLPTYEPNPPWGKKLEDGPGVNLVLVSKLADWVKTSRDTPSITLWRQYVQSQRSPVNEKFLKRLKMITRLENATEVPLMKFEKALVRRYNGKPWMVRPQYEFHRGSNYFEIDVDIHRFMYMVLKPVVPYLHKVNMADVAVALIVQGEADDELPEQVLVATRISQLDITKGVDFENVLCREPRLPKESLASAQRDESLTRSTEKELAQCVCQEKRGDDSETAPQTLHDRSSIRPTPSKSGSTMIIRLQQHCNVLIVTSIVVALCAKFYFIALVE